MDIYNIVHHYQENKDLIHSHIQGKADTMINTTIMEMSITAFFTLFIFVILAWFIGLYLLVRYWDVMPDWAKVIGTISFVFGYPILTIVLVLASNHVNEKSETTFKFKRL